MMWTIALTFLVAILAVGSGQVPGGPTTIDTNDSEFQAAQQFAIKEYNHHSNHHHYYALERVVRAQAQVVEGRNFIMTLILGKTTCSKSSDGKNCPIIRNPPEAKFIRCDFTVWSRPWLSDNRKIILTGSSCRN